jgi:hypothetical protein
MLWRGSSSSPPAFGVVPARGIVVVTIIHLEWGVILAS